MTAIPTSSTQQMAIRWLFGALATTLVAGSALHAKIPLVDQWRYTLRRPPARWQQPDFDDRPWLKGQGGFGERSTPGARVATDWQTNNIWLRKVYRLESRPQKLALLVHHDEDAEIYLNGKLVAKLPGYLTKYEVIRLENDALNAVRPGRNVLAVHCRQTRGGQFIDVHLVDPDDIPQLPPPPPETHPFQSPLITKWGEQVTAANAWREYPRPQLQRSEWTNLNGKWQYAVTDESQTQPPAKWNGEIIVPFCLESKLGGVQRLLAPNEALWYRRTFQLAPTDGGRWLLNFEAVDYDCRVWVNGQEVGSHRGGNTPFTFDITSAAKPGNNELIVRVEDETEGWQLRGKQVLNPRGIWYTRVSGIWQTVWLEHVGDTYITDLHITTSAETGSITVTAETNQPAAVARSEVLISDGRTETKTQHEGRQALAPATVTIRDAQLWSPTSPFLYYVEVAVFDHEGRELDRVQSYAGIRSIGTTRDASGHLRFTLNGKTLFHWGPLDQGWWPDGLLTPPSDEAMRSDIEFLKAAGFNMIRKHIKVEPRRYYYHCDRLGMMLWQDHVSGGKKPPWTRLQPNPQDADWPDEHHRQFMLELERMVDTLENHPSIVVWVPFNEAWGQHRTLEVGEWMVQRDPTRLVNIASGGNFWPVGHIADAHKYPHPGFPFEPKRFDDFVKVIGEFGGHGFVVPGHIWDPNRRNWGYGGLPKDQAEYRERYVTSLKMLAELRKQGIAAGVYTQTTDVEGEVNGLLTYDRKVAKIPAAELRKLSEILKTGD